MNRTDIAIRRLQSQHILQADFKSVGEAVSWMGAMQAQDYTGALWAIALRTKNMTQEDIKQAILNKEIVRTWPMRGTLHFVAAKDIRWMVRLLGPRMTVATATRRKNLHIDDSVIVKSREVITNALSGDKCLTRTSLCAVLDKHGITTASQRGIHLLRYFSETGLLCFGPHEEKQPTFVLLDEWLPATKELTQDEALTELTRRYFTSHGPASVRDYAGWAYITQTDARKGLSMIKDELTEVTIDGTNYWFKTSDTAPQDTSAFLLPGFDEYILGYKDRSAALDPTHAQKIIPGNNGMFMPTIVLNGQVVGIWKRIVRKNDIQIRLQPFIPLSSNDLESIKMAAKRYGAFMQLPINVLV
jgi:hypothetical protein